MAGYHTVRQGEHVSGIAQKYGFYSWRALWDAPENAGLRQARKSPDVLLPGDQLFIPDRQTKEVTEPTDQKHRYSVTGQPLRLRVTIGRRFCEAVSNAACEFNVGESASNVSTDGGGALQRELPLPLRTAETAQVRFEEPVATARQTLSRPINISLKLGHLDPVDEVSGQLGRLRNLGYYPFPAGEPDPELFRAAVEEFQCEHNLTVDGICGPVTRAKLEEVYGC